MKIFKAILYLIKKSDLFGCQVSFRWNEESTYESLTGGTISILLTLFFIGVFSTTLFKTINKDYINFNLSRHDLEDPSYFSTTLNQTFMFALGIEGLDMNQGERYFDVYMQARSNAGSVKNRTLIPLIPCQKEQWESRGNGEAYDRLGLNKWLCPPQETRMQFQGKFTSKSFKYYKIAVNKCNNTLIPSRPCVNDSVIDAYLNANQAFNFNYYFINTILNPGDDNYIKRYLEDRNYFPFTPTDGVSANLFISSYDIQTDESLWPKEDTITDEGGIVLTQAQTTNYKVRTTQYFKLFLRKSPMSLSISRSFRKIDDTLSYIGGLFSTITFFFIFVSWYNQLSYEIQVTRNSYYFDKNDPFDSQHFNLLIYFAYLFVQFFQWFEIQIPWPRLQRLSRFASEGNKQLNMKLIINKILFSQKLGLSMIDKSKRRALLLAEPLTLDEASKIRKDFLFYKFFRKKFFPNGESQQQNKNTPLHDVQKNTTEMAEIMNDYNNSLGKIQTLGGEQVMMGSNQQLNAEGQEKRNQPFTIEQQDEFNEVDADMKECLQKLQAEANQGDELAQRLLSNIDPRIKRRYLTNVNKMFPKKLKPINFTVKASINMQEHES